MGKRIPFFLITAGLIFHTLLPAQQTDSVKGKNIYRPMVTEQSDTIRPVSPAGIFAEDSLVRQQYIQDSIRKREIFVRDSILRRQRMLDSLNVLKNELRPVLEAYVKATRDEIITAAGDIAIQGDTVLKGYDYALLPIGVRDPYTPWKGQIMLHGKSFQYTRDKQTGRISSITAPLMKATFYRTGNGQILVIKRSPIVQKNNYGSYYREPVDSVFLDRMGRILKIKSYQLFFSLASGNSRGSLLFTNRTTVKQYIFDNASQMMQLQIVRFCERWKAYESNKVCSILTWFFSKQGNNLLATRRNDPANNYSDGTYTFTFDNSGNLKGISFANVANTESWTRNIELNKDGNVSCYIDIKNDLIFQSLCMIYHPEPGSKYAVETITTTFEKDGISYFQKNNTTGKIRTRDRMTLEWTPWQ